jgi:hypothetical protein
LENDIADESFEFLKLGKYNNINSFLEVAIKDL